MIAHAGRVPLLVAQARLLLLDEGPNLVGLNPGAPKVLHLLGHDLLAAPSYTQRQPHDRVPVNAGHALNAADAVALDQGEITASFFSVGSTFITAFLFSAEGRMTRAATRRALAASAAGV